MPAKSQAQQRFMGIVHAIQKGDAKASDFSKDAQDTAKEMKPSDAKDFASTKHKGLPNHVKKENMEKELKEIIRQTYRESLRESVNEDATELPQATIPSAVKVKLQMAIDKIKDSKLSNNAKLQLVAQVIDALDVDKSQLSNIANKIRSKMESVNESISHEAMGIASMTNTRKEAVQKFIDDNNLDAKEILTHITKGKLPERIRFVQALVGTPNNSSFKWYVKNYANESVVTEGKFVAFFMGKKIDIDGKDLYDAKQKAITQLKVPKSKVGLLAVVSAESQRNQDFKFESITEAKVIDIIDRFEHLKLPDVVYLNKKPYTGKTFVMNGYNGYTSSDDDGWVYDSKTRKPLTDKQGNTLRATTHRGAKWDFKDGIRESVTEGKKAFKINPPIGKAKYSISAHNGFSKHKDGSDFWDILIFKNKADLERRAKYFRSEKYIEENIENVANGLLN